VTDRRTEFSSLDRVCITCSAVKSGRWSRDLNIPDNLSFKQVHLSTGTTAAAAAARKRLALRPRSRLAVWRSRPAGISDVLTAVVCSSSAAQAGNQSDYHRNAGSWKRVSDSVVPWLFDIAVGISPSWWQRPQVPSRHSEGMLPSKVIAYI